ncbi:putative DOF domain class transcription factor [Hibiscus syriacus]|uniref:DOF domain class transcription factor n=1 Tax=Hibiscus syriacus TaxID=106335 RepID=A0A6A3A780_HIBSY|nr:putative DOF domain class transcription factor [Hibiscus syriacus]
MFNRNGYSEVPQRVSLRAVHQLKLTKAVERYSPRSLVSEKKRPSRISELELQNPQLQELKKVKKDQLNSSEPCKKEALQDAEEFGKQMLAMSAKVEICRKPLLEPASEGPHVNELDTAKQTIQAELVHLDLENFKGNLVEILSLVSNMKNRLKEGRESEAPAKVLASDTLLQLEAARKTVEALRSEGKKAFEAYNYIASDLHEPKERVQDKEHEESHQLEAEISSLRSALETSEIKRHEEQIQSIIQIKSANEQMDRIKSEANSREAELLAELEKANFYITTVKANLMAKETELQDISDENEVLNMKLEKSPPCQLESELKNELKVLKEAAVDLNANMMDKETELQYMA